MLNSKIYKTENVKSRFLSGKTKLFLFGLLIIFSIKGMAQAPPIEWQKCYGGSDHEGNSTATAQTPSVQQTIDGGYIFAGSTYSNDGDVTGNHGNADIWVVKVNSTGGMEWQKCLGGTNFEESKSIKQTTDGGYIVCGHTFSNDGDVTGNHGSFDIWVVKLNSTGVIEWQKCLGGTNSDVVNSMQLTADGGYVICGLSSSNNGDVTGHHGTNTSNDVWIVKLSSGGGVDWQKSLGGTADDWGYSIQQTSDGGYIAGGYTSSNDGDVTGNHGNRDVWAVKLNSAGGIEWQKCFGGTSSDEARSIIQTTDGGYMFAGLTASVNGDVTGNHGLADYWIVKLNSTSGIEWQKCLGGSGSDVANAVEQTSVDEYIICDHSSSGDGDVTGQHGGISDTWVVKINSTGDIAWEKCLGGSNDDKGYCIEQTSDNGFIIAVSSASNDGDVSGNHLNNIGNNTYDVWVVKLDNPITWTGAVSNLWRIADNWKPKQIPNSTDDVLIPAGLSVYPASAATNSCRDLTIEADASLTMTGGILNVTGHVFAASASCFNLQSGTLSLSRGSYFPPDMTFYNLKIYEDIYNPGDNFYNTYSLPGNVTVNGSFNILGDINAQNSLPNVIIENLYIKKDLIVHGGNLGLETDPDPGVGEGLPEIRLNGSSTQKLDIRNPSCNGCVNSLKANFSVHNTNINWITASSSLSIYNLDLTQDFDLKGKEIQIKGMPVSFGGKIINSKPNLGNISITHQFPITTDITEINIPSLKNLWVSGSESSYKLTGDLIVKGTLVLTNTLDLNGKNLTIGATNSSLGEIDGGMITNSALSGTLKLLGNANCPPYQLKATSLFNFTLNNNPGEMGAELNNDVDDHVLTINGKFLLTNGMFDQKDNTLGFINIQSNLKETPGNVVFSSTGGNYAAITAVSTINSPSSSRDIKGLGFIVSTNNGLGSVSITRVNNQQTGINGHTGIYRAFKIDDFSVPPGTDLHATIAIKYDTTELDGINESNLTIFHKNTEADPNWIQLPTLPVDITNHIVTSSVTIPLIDFGANTTERSIYTLGDYTDPLRTGLPFEEAEIILPENQILLYPNPAKDHLNFRMTSTTEKSEVAMYNLMGSRIMNQSITPDDSGNFSESFDISTLPAGIYIFKVADETGQQVKKFIKE